MLILERASNWDEGNNRDRVSPDSRDGILMRHPRLGDAHVDRVYQVPKYGDMTHIKQR